MIYWVGVLSLSPAKAQAWAWWWLFVIGLIVGLCALGLVFLHLRKRLLPPMSHRPTDTSDAWAEAGRRMPTPAEDDEKDAGGNGGKA